MYSCNRSFRMIMSLIAICILSASIIYAQDYLSGRVYNGNQGDESTPLLGVTVKLYGSGNAGSLGSQIGSTATDIYGYYQLLATAGYEYYSIVETDPSGYQSIAATSVSGSVINSNRIQYSVVSQPLSGQTKTGNKFWDKPTAPANNPPVAEANGPYTGTVGQSVQLTAAGSYDPDAGDYIASYVWDLDFDGQYDDASGMTPSHTWNSALMVIIYVKVTDSHGASHYDSTSVTIQAGEPTKGTLNGYKRNMDTGVGLSGWTIYIDANQNGQKDAGEKSAITNSSGFYQMSLNPGTYTVCEEMQTGWTNSTPCVSGINIIAGTTTTQDFHNQQESSGDEYDFGDAPDDRSTYHYPTLAANNGAYHGFDPNVYLGTAWDSESDGQPTSDATGDDADADGDDDDGVVFSGNLTPGSVHTVNVTASIAGYLFGWIDFDGDGDWESTETVFSNQVLSAGVNILAFNVPAGAVTGTTFARFRFSTAMISSNEGGMADGEVEDYQVTVSSDKEERDYGDAPASYGIASHDTTGHYYLGAGIDTEGASLFSPGADGDDLDNLDDEDANYVSILGTSPTYGYNLILDASRDGGYLNAWVDFNMDGDFSDIGEQIYTNEMLTAGTNVLGLTVSTNLTPGTTYGRFRYSTVRDLSPTGFASDGEVEDYIFTVQESGTQDRDYGDAPDPTYPTLLASNGARHLTNSTLYLGSTIDSELDGLTSTIADGDDQDGSDDEDGVNMSPFIAPGQTVPITVTTSAAGVVNAWLDFNLNGDWGDAGEHIIAAQPVVAGANTFTITVPANASLGLSFARFRLSSVRDLSYTGEAPDGEVEDYAIEIKEPEEGWVVIAKQAYPQDNTPFLFCTTYSSGFFNVLCFQFSGPINNTHTILNPSDLQKVEETQVPGWTLTDIQITGDTDNGSTIDLSNGSVVVDFDPGEEIIITFKNEKSDSARYDFGDAPDPNYPTLLASNGARHLIDSNLYLGSTIDSELDGLTSSAADGDNKDNSNDEDGVTLPSIITPGQTVSISVMASTSGYFAGWLDFNIDGDWNDQGERIILLESVTAGVNNMTFQVPANAVIGQSYARFRLATTHHISVDGELSDGEVEDYAVAIQEGGTGSLTIIKDATPKDDTPFWITTVWKWMGGAAPYRDPSNNTCSIINGPAGTYYVGESVPSGWTLKDIVVTGDTDNGSVITMGSQSVNVDLDDGENITVVFKNEQTDNGGYDFGDAPIGYPDASHKLGGPWLGGLGDAPDAESSSQNDPQARGDDQDGNDDEDAMVYSNLIRGQWSELRHEISTSSTGHLTLALWIDLNIDGDWNDPGEHIGTAITISALPPNSSQTLKWLMNFSPAIGIGTTFARLRIYEGSNASVSLNGAGGPGEVEDFQVEIKSDGQPAPQGAIVYGAKWNDLNGNKQWDMNEPPLANWTIWLDANQNGVEDAGDLYDQTDASGQFTFTGLSAGQYIVGETMKAGWVQTWPGGSGTHTMTVDPLKPSAGVMFGNYQSDPDLGEGAIKWNQPPLFDPMSEDTTCFWGSRELSIYSESILADDWYCHDPRPITRIRWWGSYDAWDSDIPPEDGPQYFHIGVWTDNPKSDSDDFSHPSELIHEWFVERTQVQETAMKCHWMPERMDKPVFCYQYTFDIPEDAWFFQEGESNIYWLHIAAVYGDGMTMTGWGWLNREHYFHGDAIRFNQPTEPHPGSVFEEGMPAAELWDMAFVLGTDEYDSEYDFGDAPDLGYGTTIAKNGAQHLMNPEVFIGHQLDTDFDGQPHLEAKGDDDDGLDDEDGVEMVYPLALDSKPQIQIELSFSGFLNAWMDLDQNGSWIESDDHIINNIELPAGTHLFEIPAFEDIEPGERMTRFRFSTEPNLWFKGYAIDGEVEDHLIMIDAYNAIERQSAILPDQYDLHQNFPNPFNPNTIIEYDLPEKVRIELSIYNLMGQKVIDLVSRTQEAGSYQVVWQGMDARGNLVSSGVYLCYFRTDQFLKTMKLIYIR
ncbi:GEVED domain-containing protein [bacterium]